MTQPIHYPDKDFPLTPSISTLRQSLALLSVLLLQSGLTAIPAHGETLHPALRIAFVRHGNIWLIDTSTGRRTRLTRDGHDSIPAWTLRGTSLLFQRQAGSRVETMRWQPEQGISQVRDGLWSPNTTAVAFTRPGSDTESPTTVWITRSGMTTRVTPIQPNYRWAPLAWSRASTRLALARYAIPRPVPPGQQIPPSSATLWVTAGALTSGQLKQLPMPSLSSGHPGWPDLAVWSPDGRFLTVGVGPNMFCASCRADGRSYSVVPVRGGKVVSIGSALDPDEAISWAPSGSYVVVSGPAGRETYVGKHLIRVNPASGTRYTFSRDPSAADVEPAVSPDGAHIAFARGRAQDASSVSPVTLIASRHVYVLDANRTRPHIHRLTFAPGWTDESPVWSPDGKWIVFVRWHRRVSKPAAAQLWVVQLNGTDAQLLTNLDLPASFLNGFGYYGSFGWKALFAVAP